MSRAALAASTRAGRRSTPGLVLGALAAAVVSCGSGEAERDRANVLVRVDTLRDATGAPAEDRRRLLEALRLSLIHI